MGHSDDGGEVQELQQQPLHPRLLTALHGAGRLVQDQDPGDFLFNSHEPSKMVDEV